MLGLIILRGDSVVSMTIHGPPPPEDGDVILPTGPGVANVAGRGLPIAPMGGAPIGLAGPVRGLGGPGSSVLMPPVTGTQPSIFQSINSLANLVAAQGGVSYPRPMPGMPPGMPGMPPGMPPMPGMPGMPPGMPIPRPPMMGVPPGMAPPPMMAPPRGMPPGPPPPRG